MTASLILACVWFVLANVGAMLPSRHGHRPLAFVLIAFGIPILGYVTAQHGPWLGLLVLAGGASILRWPLWMLLSWVRRLFARG